MSAQLKDLTRQKPAGSLWDTIFSIQEARRGASGGAPKEGGHADPPLQKFAV